MKLVTYRSSEGPRCAALTAGGYVDLNAFDPTLPTSLLELLKLGPDGMVSAGRAAKEGKPLADGKVQLLAPIPNPRKVICIGLNYADHAVETGAELPGEPICFNKFPTAVAAHEDKVPLPPESSEVDYEAELVVVIGKQGKNIPQAKAFEYVAGYANGNDVSARDWQLRKPGKQWLLGKTFDSFAPFGPVLVTADEVPNPSQLRIQLRLNGETMQDSSTKQLIFRVEEVVAYVSKICTLEVGDLIFTGTPPGVGMARKPPVWLKPGDVTEVEIEGLGILRNHFVAG